MLEERRDNSVIEQEIKGLKELLNFRMDVFCNQNSKEHEQINGAIVENDETLKLHNGRLTSVEKLIEQGKGASKIINIGWIVFSFIIGLIFNILIKMF